MTGTYPSIKEDGMKTKCFRFALIFALASILLAACGLISANRIPATQSPFRITLTHDAVAFKTRIALDPRDEMATRETNFFKTKAAYTPPPPTSTPLPPSSELLAALTMASTSSVVMSASTAMSLSRMAGFYRDREKGGRP